MGNHSRSKYLFILILILCIAGLGAAGKWYFLPKFFPQVGKSTDLQILQKNEVIPSLEKSVITTPSGASDFSLDSSVFQSDDITLISNFEPNETPGWQGNGVIDQKIFYEGSSSLDVVSTDHNFAVITMQKPLDLSKMESIEFMINVSDADAFETAYLDFGEGTFKSFYRYPLTNLHLGWNLIQITKEKFMEIKAPDITFSWADIQNIRFTVLSRPGSIFFARLDSMRAINNSNDYLKYWRYSLPTFLSVYPQDGKNKIMARSFGSITATMKDLEDINNFMFAVSISPQTSGRSGLFIRGNYDNGYGYYFLIGGDKRNTWEIMKRNQEGWTKPEEKIQGVIQNVLFSKDKTYWLRVDARDDLMEFYFSFDGQRYEKFGEMRDNEFRGGGVGVTVYDAASWSLFDNFEFKRY